MAWPCFPSGQLFLQFETFGGDRLRFSIKCNPILLACLKNLQELLVSYCNLVEVIFDMSGTNMTKPGGKAFGLKFLRLYHLPNLKHVWNDLQGLISFRNFQEVNVDGCKRLKTLFPKPVAKNLLKLEQLHVTNCVELEEIVGKEGAAHGEIDEMFEFPCLTTLMLSALPELKCFYRGRFNLKCPKLEKLFAYHCGKLEIFTSESQSHEEAVAEGQIIAIQEVIPILREVTLNEKDIKMLQCGGFEESPNKLKLLRLQCFHNVSETDDLPFEILLKVPNVETLEVACSGFKQIFFSQIQELKDSQLKRLQLLDLPRLNSIGSEHSSINPILENLQFLRVERCSSLTELIQSSVSFSNLKELTIFECHGLVYLFTASTAKSLVRLESIYMVECELIKEIVTEERDESNSAEEVIFGKLGRLSLNSLSSLASFHSGSSTLKFPCLNQVNISQCPIIKTFSNGIIEAPILTEIVVSLVHIPLMDDGLNSTLDKLFNEKIHFASMNNLKLSNHPELQGLWLRETLFPANCFSKLTTLVVENCEFLLDVIPSNLLPCFKNLSELRVRNCSSVEIIFDINGTETWKTEEKAFPLKKLILDQLPNLMLVWNKNPHRIISFKNLEKLKVNDCKSLQYLFPVASMAKHLLKLKVQNYGALVEILGKEDTTSGASDTFEFPRLTTVILNHLPSLYCFYPGRLNLKYPMLKVLNVYHCGKLEMFISETKSHQPLPEDHVGTPVNAPLMFLVEELTPKLEEVSLNEKETVTLWHEEAQENFLHNIKCLQLYCFHSVTDQEDKLPYGFLLRVPNLEILALACSDFRKIFPSRGLKQEFIRMLSQLRGLRLETLPKLNSIGLEELSITKCPKLIYLFTPSIARSLVQLRRMSVEKCESMEEIMAKEKEESIEDEIIFGELTKLSLNNLKSISN